MALSSFATQVAQGQSPNTDQWNAQNNGPNKVDFNDPNVPMWVKMGFPDNPDGIAAYNNIYGAPNAPTAPFIPDQGSGGLLPITGNTGGYDTSTPFGQYLADNQGNRDTWATTQKLLADYGLDGLFGWAQNELIQGRSGSEVTIDMMNQQTFKDRFPVIDELKKANLPAWSPGDIVTYEKTVSDTMRAAGLPAGFYDDPTTDIQKFILHGVAATEVEDRINNGYLAVMQQPQDVRDQWYNLGYTTGDMVAHFLDPDVTEALLTKQQAATARAAEAKRAGYGQLTTSEADFMGGRPDISSTQSQQGFNQLVQQHELFGALPGENGAQDITREQQLAAAFSSSAPDQQAIQRRADERKAAIAGNGAYTQGQDGRTGVGTAR